jgi:dihydroxyacetone kinase DhaKLM complex PTS-EIIA-like component DhaM
MDRDEALKLLLGGTQGVRTWNEQDSTKDEIPNLGGANLAGANLDGVRLRKVNLYRAKLSGTRLVRASLYRANLVRADLTGADLTGADLTGANLAGANLAGARPIGADLTGTKLDQTDLTGADLAWAKCFDTAFSELDLSQTKGLDKLVHTGPCSVGVDTLFLSGGQIPEAFLRGCGVPDALISYLPALIGSVLPIQFYSCFISHSSRDAKFATRLHSRMTQEKLRVWYAPEDMKAGHKSIDQIDQAIRVHDKLLLVLSKASMGSDWVQHEVIRAVEREKAEERQILFPIGLVEFNAIKSWTAFDSDLGRDLAKVVREYHIPDFSKWKDHDAFERSFARLLDDLKSRDVQGPG